MTEQEYRSADGVNKSSLWNMNRSPAHYLYYLQHPQEDTSAFRFGRAFHAAVLTPTAFKREYYILPEEIDRRTSAGKKKYDMFLESADGREILSKQEGEQIRQMVKVIRSCPDAQNLLKGTRRERPIFWTDDNGILCKCRVDAYKPGIMIDLKTAKDAETNVFTKDAIRNGYHLQAAHYIDGYQHTIPGPEPTWYFIVIEKDPPFSLNILKADRGFIDYGIKIRQRLMKRLIDCRKRGSYPGYGINDLIAPNWTE